MKSINKWFKFVPFGIGVLVWGIIFLPIVQAGDTKFLLFESLFGLNGTSFKPLLYFVFIPLIIAPFFVLFVDKNKNMPTLSMMLFILSGVVIILVPSFYIGFDIQLTLTQWGIAASCLEFIAAMMCLILAYEENKYTVYDIVESAMLIALAIGLDLPGLKIRLGANGGSISFTMIPLFILALRQGPIKGFLGCGIVYGLITCLTDGWGLMYFPFDYLLGYGSIACIGFFQKQIFKDNNTKLNWHGIVFIAIGTLLSIAGRLLSSTLSGMIFYEMNFVDSLIYNSIYILPSGAIALAALLALYKPLLLVNNSVNKRFSQQ